MSRIVWMVVSGLIASVAAIAPSHAWDGAGHRIVARIAEANLLPTPRAEVQRLLTSTGDQPNLVAITSWADGIRGRRPETRTWHFVAIPRHSNGYDAARDCPNDSCVVQQINVQRRRLANGHLPDANRSEALKFVVHFVGDLHQPLHCLNDNDRGGVLRHVVYDGQKLNLHKIWNGTIVIRSGGDSWTPRLLQAITDQQRNAWSGGSPEQWVNESFDISKRQIYGEFGGGSRDASRPRVIDPRHYAAMSETAGRRLAQAGIRLAAIINETLGQRP